MRQTPADLIDLRRRVAESVGPRSAADGRALTVAQAAAMDSKKVRWHADVALMAELEAAEQAYTATFHPDNEQMFVEPLDSGIDTRSLFTGL